MQTRSSEDELLLQADDLAEARHDQDMLAKLPTDIQKYLLPFCTLQTIGSLAQANKKMHRIINDEHFTKKYEVHSYFPSPIPDADGGTRILLMNGYLTGSYAQLRNFFAERNRDEQRIAELDASCCMNKQEMNAWLYAGAFFFGMIGSVTGTGMTALFYFLGGLEQAATTAVITAPFCLLPGCGMVCVCVNKHIEHKIQTRNALQNNLNGAPKPASLHGTLFSRFPTEQHEDHIPVKLGMHE